MQRFENPPVFLSADGPAMSLIRQALSAHPHFFTCHVPGDEVELIEAWALEHQSLHSTRRMVWLSHAAFLCATLLERQLPGVRFIRVARQAFEQPANDLSCLELSADEVVNEPKAALAKILAFLGECEPPEACESRCA
jgi:hypothetical protein